jgi:hypothetical protein
MRIPCCLGLIAMRGRLIIKIFASEHLRCRDIYASQHQISNAGSPVMSALALVPGNNRPVGSGIVKHFVLRFSSARICWRISSADICQPHSGSMAIPESLMGHGSR